MLFDKLKNYSESGIYPFHMPGHKRNSIDSSNLIPYDLDLTEIYDFDNLHDANGCIKEIAKKAEKLYKVRNCFLLVNGATGGILSSIRSLTKYGDEVALARNCHKSVYNAIELFGLNPHYIIPDVDNEFGIATSISPENVEKKLNSNPNIKLLILTSPTYEGIVSDIESISKICHSKGVKLFVDEAHGAHFPFSDYFPKSAIDCGADIAVVSLHKTLPSLTQTALAFTNDNNIAKILQDNLSIFESSSPSYILMTSVEKCLDFLETSKTQFIQYNKLLDKFYIETKTLKHLRILHNSNSFKNHCFDVDKGKLVISTRNTSLSGIELASILRNEYKIETEMAYSDYAIAMSSVCDTEGGFIKLIKALKEIDLRCFLKGNNGENANFITESPIIKFKPSLKYEYSASNTLLAESIGKVSLEYIWAYPPGIPLIVPGEVISSQLIETINNLIAKDVDVYSTEKNLPKFISTAEFD